MKKIANIVSDSKLDISHLFNVVKTMEEITHGLPTLIIDLEYIDKHYPNFDIGSNCVESNLYWAFKKSQDRDRHSKGLEFFINKVYDDLIKDVPYFFVDLINYQPKTIIKLIKKIYNSEKVVSYINKDMIYLYCDKIVFGIDLKLLIYMGIDSEKIKNKIKFKSSMFVTHDDIVNDYGKIFEEIENKERYIPYLLYLTNY